MLYREFASEKFAFDLFFLAEISADHQDLSPFQAAASARGEQQ
jgi:hypothetical protein